MLIAVFMPALTAFLVACIVVPTFMHLRIDAAWERSGERTPESWYRRLG